MKLKTSLLSGGVFCSGCGFEEFTPETWDHTLGSWVKLPK